MGVYCNLRGTSNGAFIESAVDGTLLAPAMDLFNQAFSGIADGTRDVVEAQGLIIDGFGIINPSSTTQPSQ